MRRTPALVDRGSLFRNLYEYPNGLFYCYSFCVGPFAEYFASILRSSVEGMKSCIVGSLLHILECYSHSASFYIFLNKCSVIYRTFLAVYTLNGRSKYYVITCCIFRFCISYSYCASAYFYICDLWCRWCCSSYFKFLDVRPCAK